jgi:Cu(I)/Ag(I) efflux system periplasmic protein CusF
MHHSTKIALFALFSVVMASGAQASEMKHADMGEMKMASEASAQQQVINSKGVVKEIDLNSKKITIAHEAIPAVGWPAMTMRFTFVTLQTTASLL